MKPDWKVKHFHSRNACENILYNTCIFQGPLNESVIYDINKELMSYLHIYVYGIYMGEVAHAMPGSVGRAYFNSLAPGNFELNFRSLIFQIISVIGGWGISCELPLSWMSIDLTDKSTLVQVMAWCRQATSHYLRQCWLRSLSPYGLTRPQWVNKDF